MLKSILNLKAFSLYSILIFFTLHSSVKAQIPNFHIGTRWIYETVEGPLPVQTGFELFQITDTTQLHGKSVFVIEDGYGHDVEYMHVENAKVYFWDDGTDNYQLTYDFGSDSLYNTNWHSCGGNEGEAVIRIDSITTFSQQGDSLELQHVSIENNGTSEDDIITGIYKNIGLMEFGLRLPLGFDVCDFAKHITKLRCFENDSLAYHFVNYPCDSTWSSLLTEDDLVDFVSPKKTWTEGYYNNGWWSYKYKFDTIPFVFEGKTYYQLLKAYTEFSNNWESDGSLIRYENGRVFEHGNANEQIIYDFNLMEGDTFHLGDSSYPMDLLVTDTDSIALLNGVLRKRLILEAIDPSGEVIASDIIWIEGIGNLQGLYTNYLPWSADWDPSYILCVRWNDNVVYDNQDIDSCWMMTTSIDDPLEYDQPVFPNPTSGIIHILGNEKELPYELYDIQGMKIQRGSSKNGEILIDNEGLYFLKIFMKNKWEIKKVIVIGRNS